MNVLWVWLPRRLARRSPLAGTVAADGHHLAVWPGVGVLLPLVALAAGVAAGWLRPGYATSPTESLWLLVGVATLGCLSAQAGAWFTAGFVAGDLAGLPAWTLEVPADAAGLPADPVAAGVVFLVAPRVVVWLLVSLLAVGVPVAARGLTRSVAVRLRSTPGVDLSVAALCTAVAGYVLARLWGAAAAPAIRPVFTFLPRTPPGSGFPPRRSSRCRLRRRCPRRWSWRCCCGACWCGWPPPAVPTGWRSSRGGCWRSCRAADRARSAACSARSGRARPGRCWWRACWTTGGWRWWWPRR